MQMNFALSCELREKKSYWSRWQIYVRRCIERERERTSYFLSHFVFFFSTVTYSLLISLMHILPYWLTNCIAKKRSACKNHNSAATHNERAFFRENSAFALSHSSAASSYCHPEKNICVHDRTRPLSEISRSLSIDWSVETTMFLLFPWEMVCSIILWSNM